MIQDTIHLKRIIEAALFAADEPLSIARLLELFEEENKPEKAALSTALAELQDDYAGHSLTLQEVASGFRFQVRAEFAPWIQRLWEMRPARYSRAALETLALIAYRQPITRAEIEDVRGVAVSSSIIKTLLEREWVRIVGYKDAPGKPALYATTNIFLDYFNLSSLSDLPSLAELQDLDSISVGMDAVPITGEDAAEPQKPPIQEHVEYIDTYDIAEASIMEDNSEFEEEMVELLER